MHYRFSLKKYNFKTEKMANKSLNINEISQLFHNELSKLRASFLDAGDKRISGLGFQDKYTDLIDKTIKKIAGSLPPGTPLALIALGGYGRRELAPYSDIDLVFIHEAPLDKAARKLIESLTGQLWALGLKLSASTRSLEDCEKAMGEDLSFLTSLLEKRLIQGPASLFQKLDKTFRKHLKATPPGYFIAAKLSERDLAHRKTGDSRYRLEPNIKEGKGALRDIHTLVWITNFLYGVRRPRDMVARNILTPAEAATLEKALHFFWTARCHLHFMAGRANDRLAFDVQPRLAELMGYRDAEPHVRGEKFMKDYFLLTREVGHLTRTLCARLEADSIGGATAGGRKLILQDAIEGFPVKANRLSVKDPGVFRKTPAEIIRLFRVSQSSNIDIHPDALRAMRETLGGLEKHAKTAYPVFLEILLDPARAEQTLRRMNEADVLGALMPDFNNIVAHMQYDMYHAFTADEHTIHAVGLMHDLENGKLAAAAPLATEIFQKTHSRRALYTAMLLHDIAKGTGADHSESGAKIARKICPLLGLSPEEAETVSWLVQEHLVMTLTAYKRDLSDPKTITDFVSLVQSPERLKLLTILTTADIMAVGPELWNGWKAGLLAELYHKSLDAMARVTPPAAKLPKNDTFEAGKTVIKITPHPREDYTEVSVTAPDKKGLFARLSGALAASGASIVAARIFTLNDGLAQDVFQIQTLKGHVYDNTAFLQKTLKAALDGRLDLAGEIKERQKIAPKKSAAFRNPSRVIFDNDASASNTVVEVNGEDRPGFLYAVTAALNDQGLQISAAKIATFGSRAVDVFYVRDSFGLKILHPEKLKTIENGVKHALEQGL